MKYLGLLALIVTTIGVLPILVLLCLSELTGIDIDINLKNWAVALVLLALTRLT